MLEVQDTSMAELPSDIDMSNDDWTKGDADMDDFFPVQEVEMASYEPEEAEMADEELLTESAFEPQAYFSPTDNQERPEFILPVPSVSSSDPATAAPITTSVEVFTFPGNFHPADVGEGAAEEHEHEPSSDFLGDPAHDSSLVEASELVETSTYELAEPPVLKNLSEEQNEPDQATEAPLSAPRWAEGDATPGDIALNQPESNEQSRGEEEAEEEEEEEKDGEQAEEELNLDQAGVAEETVEATVSLQPEHSTPSVSQPVSPVEPPPPISVKFLPANFSFYFFSAPQPPESKQDLADPFVMFAHKFSLYHAPLPELFVALREQSLIAQAVGNAEILLEAKELQLLIGEDNKYAAELSLAELDLLHDHHHTDEPLRIQLNLNFDRFILRYRELMNQVEQAVEASDFGNEEADDPAEISRAEDPNDDSNGRQTHVESRGGSPPSELDTLLSHGIDAPNEKHKREETEADDTAQTDGLYHDPQVRSRTSSPTPRIEVKADQEEVRQDHASPKDHVPESAPSAEPARPRDASERGKSNPPASLSNNDTEGYEDKLELLDVPENYELLEPIVGEEEEELEEAVDEDNAHSTHDSQYTDNDAEGEDDTWLDDPDSWQELEPPDYAASDKTGSFEEAQESLPSSDTPALDASTPTLASTQKRSKRSHDDLDNDEGEGSPESERALSPSDPKRRRSELT
ncbi:hypothetical protein SISNIDRAFT_545857 [Sistotremastrum niveocremeum HHB9708]|uniref:Uncharacterized protein n=1 Tax=Sistotremastrum niveocremeum HHB9708 TaxID=1314777 RepID=A0A165AHV5_9AGAM|nr:hypothetical protein SISNIDRAFT_545857 [Sistotremastrum niveocremeum HHB9708]